MVDSSVPAEPGIVRALKSASVAGDSRSAAIPQRSRKGTSLALSRADTPQVITQRPSLVWLTLGERLGNSTA